ncbi:MAG: Gfo/Idh/MocA family protein [Chloroflexota bacterium]
MQNDPHAHAAGPIPGRALDGPPVNFAVLGAGMIAEYHARAVQANQGLGARLAAIGHYDRRRFDEIEARYGVPCRSEAELLADPQVDVVCICTPSGQHAAQAIAAAEAGKHVLVEKPMATRVEDAQAMIAACRANRVRLGVAYQSRTRPIFQRIRAAIAAGELGELTLGLVNLPFYRPPAYYRQAAWRGTWAMDGGGALMNQGIHQVDLLGWFMGAPAAVTAHALTLQREIEVEDTLSASLRFPSGALAAINATTTAAPGFPPRVEIYGTLGGVQVEGDTLMRWWTTDSRQEPVEAPAGPASAGAGADPRGIQLAGHTALVGDFIGAVREGRPPLVDGDEGLRSLAIVCEIYRQAGRIV